jgi:uncharacterized protein YggE
MNTNVKTYLGWAGILSMLMVAFAVWSSAQSYSRSIQPSSFRSFSVTGEGKVTTVPDIATFTFGVATEGGKNLADIQKENTEHANTAIAFVKAAGVDAKDIQTENYDVSPRYQYANCGGNGISICPPPTIVGYTVSQTVRVKVRDFTKAGDIVGGVVEKGANTVSSLSFTIDDPSTVETAARAKAIAQAKEKASAVADAGGFSIGRLLGIEEGGGFTPMYYNTMEKFGRGGASDSVAPAPSIEPGSRDVMVNVTLRYEIR